MLVVLATRKSGLALPSLTIPIGFFLMAKTTSMANFRLLVHPHVPEDGPVVHQAGPGHVLAGPGHVRAGPGHVPVAVAMLGC